MLFSVFRTFSTFERGKYISSHFRVNTRHFCWVTDSQKIFETENSFKNCECKKKIVRILFAAQNVWKSPLLNSFVSKSFIIQEFLNPLCEFANSSHFVVNFYILANVLWGWWSSIVGSLLRTPWPVKPVRKWSFGQGILTKRDSSVQLTS